MDNNIHTAPPAPPVKPPADDLPAEKLPNQGAAATPPQDILAKPPKNTPAQNTNPAPAAAMPVLKRINMTGREKLKKSWQFIREAWDEHELWVEMLAVKGGASAIVIAGIVGFSTALALPFMAAAGVITGCFALIGIGIYGCAAGGARFWESTRNVWDRVWGNEPRERPKKEKRDIIARLKERPWVKKALQHRFAQKVFNSKAWKMTEKFTRKREKPILQGMAVGGALVGLVIGISMLATQVLVLSAITLGTIVSFASAEILTFLATGTYGLYLSGQSIMKSRREKKEEKLARLEKPLQLNGAKAAPQADTKPAADNKPLTPVFTDKAAAPDAPQAEQQITAVPAAKKLPPAAAPPQV